MEQWTKTADGTFVNDGELGPWGRAGVDDGIIQEFVKLRFIKEKRMMIIFELVVTITCVAFIINNMMIDSDIALMAVAFVLAIFSNICLINNYNEIGRMKVNLLNKCYSVCDCTAFDVFINVKEKHCCVKDMSGTVLLGRTENGEVSPQKLSYYGFFDEKDYNAQLLKIMDGRGKMHYFVMLDKYLKNEENKKKL